MKQIICTIKDNTNIAAGIWKMVLEGDGTAVTAPGQFIDIKLDGRFLRRPVSVHDADEKSITILYKVLGKGTEEMTAFEPGRQLDVLAGCGNGFWMPKGKVMHPLLIGGGVGIPPLYLLAKKLIAAGKKPQAVLGFNSEADAFCIEDFRALGCEVRIASADGSLGTKVFVTDALPAPDTYDCFYTCGPLPMLRALADYGKDAGIPVYISME